MADYKLTKKAVLDLTQIWNYTLKRWSEDQADRYYHMLIENCKEVARSLNLGKDYSCVQENLLGFKSGRHIIFYRPIDHNSIEITRILHEQMDIENRIKDK
jgi:toxin ParE1/3/4